MTGRNRNQKNKQLMVKANISEGFSEFREQHSEESQSFLGTKKKTSGAFVRSEFDRRRRRGRNRLGIVSRE